jgi:hypothetical protein
VNDDYRIAYLHSHLKACQEAMQDGVELLGYCAWSFTDILSWLNGYQKRYGFVYVDRDEQEGLFVASRKRASTGTARSLQAVARPCNGPGAPHLVCPMPEGPLIGGAFLVCAAGNHDRLDKHAARGLDALGGDPAAVIGEQGGDGTTDVVGLPTRPRAVWLARKSLTPLLSRTTPPPKSVSMAPGPAR